MPRQRSCPIWCKTALCQLCHVTLSASTLAAQTWSAQSLKVQLVGCLAARICQPHPKTVWKMGYGVSQP